MAGRTGGKVQRDNAVTSGLGDLFNEQAAKDAEFRAAAADTDARLNFFQQFAKARIKRNMSQGEIAQRMSTTQSAISEMEKGVVEPRLSTLQRYARILGYKLRFVLIEAYNDRAIHYETGRQLPSKADEASAPASLEPLVTVVTLGNVSHLKFEDFERDDSELGGSLAARLSPTASG